MRPMAAIPPNGFVESVPEVGAVADSVSRRGDERGTRVGQAPPPLPAIADLRQHPRDRGRGVRGGEDLAGVVAGSAQPGAPVGWLARARPLPGHGRDGGDRTRLAPRAGGTRHAARRAGRRSSAGTSSARSASTCPAVSGALPAARSSRPARGGMPRSAAYGSVALSLFLLEVGAAIVRGGRHPIQWNRAQASDRLARDPAAPRGLRGAASAGARQRACAAHRKRRAATCRCPYPTTA